MKKTFAVLLAAVLILSFIPSAFAHGGESSFKLPDSLTVIEDSAFEGAVSIGTVDIPESVSSIGESSFADTGATLIARNSYILDYAIGSGLNYLIPITEAEFPDPVFRDFVTENYDGDSDGYLSDAELEAVTSMDVSDRNLNSLKGIEHFISLTELDCSGNMLTSLVLETMPLHQLDCSENRLTRLELRNEIPLDLSNLPVLQEVDCRNNRLTSLDLTGCTALFDLLCIENQLTALDISDSISISRLICWGNQISSIDVSQNHDLKMLVRENTHNTQYYGQFYENSYQLYIASDPKYNGGQAVLAYDNNTQIIGGGFTLSFDANGGIFETTGESVREITDIPKYTSVELDDEEQPVREGYVFIGWSQDGSIIDSLNIGERDQSVTAEWELPVPSLVTITTEAGTYALGDELTLAYTVEGMESSHVMQAEWQVGTDGEWTTIAAQTAFEPYTLSLYDTGLQQYRVIVNGVESEPISIIIFSYVIPITEAEFPDPIFRSFVTENYDGDSDGYLSDIELEAVTSMDVSNRNLSSLGGIEHFTALTDLDCSFNRLTSLVLESMPLHSLACTNNQLTTLELQNERCCRKWTAGITGSRVLI